MTPITAITSESLRALLRTHDNDIKRKVLAMLASGTKAEEIEAVCLENGYFLPDKWEEKMAGHEEETTTLTEVAYRLLSGAPCYIVREESLKAGWCTIEGWPSLYSDALTILDKYMQQTEQNRK